MKRRLLGKILEPAESTAEAARVLNRSSEAVEDQQVRPRMAAPLDFVEERKGRRKEEEKKEKEEKKGKEEGKGEKGKKKRKTSRTL